jgi:hypothetical protein
MKHSLSLSTAATALLALAAVPFRIVAHGVAQRAAQIVPENSAVTYQVIELGTRGGTSVPSH